MFLKPKPLLIAENNKFIIFNFISMTSQRPFAKKITKFAIFPKNNRFKTLPKFRGFIGYVSRYAFTKERTSAEFSQERPMENLVT